MESPEVACGIASQASHFVATSRSIADPAQTLNSPVSPVLEESGAAVGNLGARATAGRLWPILDRLAGRSGLCVGMDDPIICRFYHAKL